MRIELMVASTTAKCHAEGRAAANANMRKHKCSDWSREDYDIATIVTEVCLLGAPNRTETEPSEFLRKLLICAYLVPCVNSFFAKVKLFKSM
jgi:hypothetical protein